MPEHRWWVGESLWRMAEEYGFDHGWTYDHLGWRSLVDRPWFSAVPTLTAAAMTTSRMRIGTFVASPNFRHPVTFARDVTALDDISDGRLNLGIGAGGNGFDDTVLGSKELSARHKVDRLSEFLELLDEILTKDKTTWHGEYFHAVEARRAPGCVQQPRVPFLVAANGVRTMRLAARFGNGWVTTGAQRDNMQSWWRSVSDLSAQFDESLHQADRAAESVDRYLSLDASPDYSLSSVECFRDMVGRASELGFTDVVVHWPRAESPYAGQESVLEEVAAEVLPTLGESE